MDYLNKEYEKFAIDILKHYRELKLFINNTSGKNVLNISYNDIEGTKRLVYKLDKAMSMLNPIQRELIKLRYLDGLDWQLTSENIGCSIRTAYNRNKEVINIIVQALFGENIERDSLN
ncbi:sigma-70 region 4 domain-containing protein [Clostridioides mangenotii]|uniref:RNA polymerase sigma factor n=1 Tax=Metaclostridioides mangenotii TaxID=1540 RepID=UPI001C1125FF|nr:sigma-70 region 4 domain-containing protein [Clostridioides mangenotii]MBU5308514.1 sigma-70 region 4 domain-containing protein [Clostridioides mangenotii]